MLAEAEQRALMTSRGIELVTLPEGERIEPDAPRRTADGRPIVYLHPTDFFL